MSDSEKLKKLERAYIELARELAAARMELKQAKQE